MSEPFGFEVEYEENRGALADRSGWYVRLPHQCDEWDIAGSEYDQIPQDEAVAEFERFIAEAQQALAALREGRKFGGGQ